MKNTYFVYQDPYAVERQSDGVEFCTINEFDNNRIYYYCSEYMLFWDSIEESGQPDKAKNFSSGITIIPATLVRICEENLCKYIDTIKQYDTDEKKGFDIKYIHLK